MPGRRLVFVLTDVGPPREGGAYGGFTVRLVLLLFCAAALLLAACDDAGVSGDVRTRAEAVEDNTRLVRDALERFAFANNGDYPRRVTSETPAGSTLVDFLPGGELLLNPYTREHTEPRMCALTGAPGEIHYEPGIEVYYLQTSPVPGYRLAGYAGSAAGNAVLDTVAVAEFTAGPDSLLRRDARVLANCRAVRDAAEAFADRNNGVYPGGGADANLDGDTLIDLLPGGRLLTNPYTMTATEPVFGVAATYGQTGYLGTDTDGNGTVDGFLITAYLFCGGEVVYAGP